VYPPLTLSSSSMLVMMSLLLESSHHRNCLYLYSPLLHPNCMPLIMPWCQRTTSPALSWTLTPADCWCCIPLTLAPQYMLLRVRDLFCRSCHRDILHFSIVSTAHACRWPNNYPHALIHHQGWSSVVTAVGRSWQCIDDEEGCGGVTLSRWQAERSLC
jgi:hypothetical protein